MGKNQKRKAQPGGDTSQGLQKKAKTAKQSTPKKPVAMNDLPWKTVDVSDQLDDWEGLYGLEEVEGIEVLRDSDTGRLSWIPTKDVISTTLVDADEGTFQNQDEAPEEDDDEGDEEWNGFEDGEASSVAAQDEIVNSDLQKRKPILKNHFSNTSFSALDEKALDEDDIDIDLEEWQGLGISPEVLAGVSKLKFHSPTRIQSSAIPEILSGHDVIGKASTGSGKTLAFGIPIFEAHIQDPTPAFVRENGHKTRPALALILAPTRELAHQIGDHFTAFRDKAEMNGPKIAVITGGLSIHKQKRLLENADVVIGTPGRLWEHLSQSDLREKLKSVKFLVLDEADRLLSDGHFKELEHILDALDKSEIEVEEQKSTEDQVLRQTLIFSATFNKGLQYKLASKRHLDMNVLSKRESMEYLLKKIRFRQEKPKFIDADPISQLAEGITEELVECNGLEKDLYLYSILLLKPRTRTLIFVNSISAVRRITPFLQNLNMPTQPLHSNMEQKARLRTMEKFSKTAGSILVATDVAARGLDIPSVSLIVHYHLPRTADMYIHRSGRTARGDDTGTSVVICSPEEVAPFRRLISRLQEQNSQSSMKHKVEDLELDRRIVGRLKQRSDLAKKIADVSLSKEVNRSEKDLFREAAEDLGFDYDSDELESTKGKRGRGNARRAKQKENKEIPKAQITAWKAELKDLLAQRVNTGVSEKYIAQGLVDVDALLRGERGEFLGDVDL